MGKACSFNRQQNRLRHFAPKDLSDVLPTSKGEHEAFPSPPPPWNVGPSCSSYQNEPTNTPTLNGGGRGVGCFFFEVTPFEEEWPVIA